MYVSGSLLYFTPFYFKNGNQSKPKYMLILKLVDKTCLYASLTTSQDHIPEFIKKEYGCINYDEYSINCFFIPANKSKTDTGFMFPLDTYIYGQQIDEYQIPILKKLYTKNSLDYHEMGKINPDIFESIIKCFTNSKNVKQKIKRILLF